MRKKGNIWGGIGGKGVMGIYSKTLVCYSVTKNHVKIKKLKNFFRDIM